MQDSNLEPITVSIKTGERLIGCGHTKMYELINEGVVDTIRIGRRRFLVYASLKALAEGGINASAA